MFGGSSGIAFVNKNIPSNSQQSAACPPSGQIAPFNDLADIISSQASRGTFGWDQHVLSFPELDEEQRKALRSVKEVANKVETDPEVYHCSLNNQTMARFFMKPGGVNRNYFRYTNDKHINAGAKALMKLGIPAKDMKIKVGYSGEKELLNFFKCSGKDNIRANPEGYSFYQKWLE